MKITEGHLARGSHAVDFLIVIKMLILVKRSCDNHALLGNICQRYVKSKEFTGVAIVAVGSVKAACFTVIFKGHIACADLGVDIALLAR